MWGIARKYAVSVADLAQANNLDSSYEIEVGQILLLPDGAMTSRSLQTLYRSGGFSWPVTGTISSGYGWRSHPVSGEELFHEGIDIAAPYGTKVGASAPGKVTFAGWEGGYGRLVIVRHDAEFETRYAHLSGWEVSAGDEVKEGQALGYVGSSGDSTGPHLHFEVRRNGMPEDPRDYLP